MNYTNHQLMVGHKNLQTTQRYIEVDTDCQRKITKSVCVLVGTVLYENAKVPPLFRRDYVFCKGMSLLYENYWC